MGDSIVIDPGFGGMRLRAVEPGVPDLDLCAGLAIDAVLAHPALVGRAIRAFPALIDPVSAVPTQTLLVLGLRHGRAPVFLSLGFVDGRLRKVALCSNYAGRSKARDQREQRLFVRLRDWLDGDADSDSRLLRMQGGGGQALLMWLDEAAARGDTEPGVMLLLEFEVPA
jgi:hypothetical protein